MERDDYRLKLSDVNLLLGEVGMESDQYEQAILDMQSCLQLRQFVLEPSDRRIAEVYGTHVSCYLMFLSLYAYFSHFSLGLAYTLNKQFDEAITVSMHYCAHGYCHFNPMYSHHRLTQSQKRLYLSLIHI